MQKTENFVRLLQKELEHKTILEAACGTADFSLAASRYASDIQCIDLDDKRLSPSVLTRENIHFQVMDAAKMTFAEDFFDIVILYNALYHIRSQYDAILAECRRVLRENGRIWIIGTWKLDTSLMAEMFGSHVERQGEYHIVRLEKRES